MNLKPIKNIVLFQFNDHVNTKGEFERQVTEGGIFLEQGYDDSAKNPRWATVLAVGPDCTQVVVGQEILLPALRWTNVIKHEGTSFWKTDEKEVVATRSKGIADTLKAVNDFVLFIDQKLGAVHQEGLIAVVGGANDTPRGKVLSIGSKCYPELVPGVSVYYDKTNFFDVFDTGFKNTRLSFIQEEKIMAYSL